MPRLREVVRGVRSKNAGPFWVTIDIFFDGADSYERHRGSAALSATAIGRVYAVDPASVKCFPVDDLNVVKISYPRPEPQGGVVERDMHAGQQYARLLDVDLG
jgi:hypothetical protein